MSNDLYHFSFWMFPPLTIICNFNNNLVSTDSTFRTLQGNKNIRSKFRIIRNCKSKILTLVERTYHLFHSTFYYFKNFSLPALPCRNRRYRHLHGIQMHCTIHIICRNKNIFFLSFDGNKAIPLRMRCEGSNHLFYLTLCVFPTL